MTKSMTFKAKLQHQKLLNILYQFLNKIDTYYIEKKKLFLAANAY